MWRTHVLRCAAGAGQEVKIAAALKTFKLTPGATLEQVKRRYHRLAVTTHPDRGGSAERFLRIREHYEVLQAAMGGGGGGVVEDADIDAFVRDFETAILERDAEKFKQMTDTALGSNCLLTSTKLLYLIIEGGALYHPIGRKHTGLCIDAIARWEGLTGLQASHDVFNSLIYPYAFLRKGKGDEKLADGEMLAACITVMCEEMQLREMNPEADWWTKRLIDKALKSSGKFSQPELFDHDDPASWKEAKAVMERGAPSRGPA
eukprot:TRINITY_DN15131_c0_g1_i1.p1 TRINITY_DN15131_c0_g1~~TRINITY_DN15131_c0_g1_i1.p1  ORF type:complete len:261 (+),score=82.67 TRINITY_DN15131_c0_g1_i1:80-862(+)